MCGIFGAIGKWNPHAIKFMAYLNETRGSHASGFFTETQYIKKAVPMEETLLAYEDIFENPSRYIVGHTRFATQGDKAKDKNAHPFLIGNIVGVHNGMLYNDYEIGRINGKHYDVDSEYIFDMLNREHDQNKALKICDGYWGLAWEDKSKPDKIFLAKHDNTLAMYKTDDCIYFSSDIYHLQICFGQKEAIVELEEDSIYCIDINTLEITNHIVSGLTKSVWHYTCDGTDEANEDGMLVCEHCGDFFPEMDQYLGEEFKGYTVCMDCIEEAMDMMANYHVTYVSVVNEMKLFMEESREIEKEDMEDDTAVIPENTEEENNRFLANMMG